MIEPDRIYFNGAVISDHMHISTVPYAGGRAYLRATPAREHAEELAEALRVATSALREIRDDNKARGGLYSSKTQGLCRSALKAAGAALAKLEKERKND